VDVCFVLAHILDNFQLLFYEPCAFSYLSYILLILREIWFCRGNHWDLIIVYKMQSSKAQSFMLCIGHRDLYLSSSKLCSAGRQFLPSVSFASSQGIVVSGTGVDTQGKDTQRPVVPLVFTYAPLGPVGRLGVFANGVLGSTRKRGANGTALLAPG
jgi:hypothetical protein